MKTLDPKKKRKAVDSTQKMMRDIEPFLPKRIRLYREKTMDWCLRETPCDKREKNGAKALLSEL